MSCARMGKYVAACHGNTRNAMTLYRLNLKLSQEIFTIISCFEVCIRNRICDHYSKLMGNEWLRDSVKPGGIFDNYACRFSKKIIDKAAINLTYMGNYSHNKLIAEMGFGFWRYLFASDQFRAGGQTLLQIFPNKPISTPVNNYNHTFILNKLTEINELRNRVAHHEPICFLKGKPIKDTMHVRAQYLVLKELFRWMSVNESSLLYGLDHVMPLCNSIDEL